MLWELVDRFTALYHVSSGLSMTLLLMELLSRLQEITAVNSHTETSPTFKKIQVDHLFLVIMQFMGFTDIL
jgi:hypothetical protein